MNKKSNNKEIQEKNKNVDSFNLEALKKKVKILKFQNTLSGEKSKYDIRKIRRGIARELTLLNTKKNNNQN